MVKVLIACLSCLNKSHYSVCMLMLCIKNEEKRDCWWSGIKASVPSRMCIIFYILETYTRKFRKKKVCVFSLAPTKKIKSTILYRSLKEKRTTKKGKRSIVVFSQKRLKNKTFNL